MFEPASAELEKARAKLRAREQLAARVTELEQKLGALLSPPEPAGDDEDVNLDEAGAENVKRIAERAQASFVARLGARVDELERLVGSLTPELASPLLGLPELERQLLELGAKVETLLGRESVAGSGEFAARELEQKVSALQLAMADGLRDLRHHYVGTPEFQERVEQFARTFTPSTTPATPEAPSPDTERPPADGTAPAPEHTQPVPTSVEPG
jgi:chromosome segregation ATPase